MTELTKEQKQAIIETAKDLNEAMDLNPKIETEFKSKTEGKAVRGVNFCKRHRPLAVFVRDDPAIKKGEIKQGHTFSGQQFVQVIIDIVNEAAGQDIKFVGT